MTEQDDARKAGHESERLHSPDIYDLNVNPNAGQRMQDSPEPESCPVCGRDVPNEIAQTPEWKAKATAILNVPGTAPEYTTLCTIHQLNTLQEASNRNKRPLNYSKEDLVQRVRDLESTISKVAKDGQGARSSRYFNSGFTTRFRDYKGHRCG